MSTVASAQKRYLDSILAQGRMSGEMQDRDFRARSARDAIAQYNRKMLNGNAQTGFQDSLSRITGQQPGVDSLTAFDQNDATGIRNQWANLGAAGGHVAKAGVSYLQDSPDGLEETGKADDYEKRKKAADDAFDSEE